MLRSDSHSGQEKAVLEEALKTSEKSSKKTSDIHSSSLLYDDLQHENRAHPSSNNEPEPQKEKTSNESEKSPLLSGSLFSQPAGVNYNTDNQLSIDSPRRRLINKILRELGMRQQQVRQQQNLEQQNMRRTRRADIGITVSFAIALIAYEVIMISLFEYENDVNKIKSTKAMNAYVNTTCGEVCPIGNSTTNYNFCYTTSCYDVTCNVTLANLCTHLLFDFSTGLYGAAIGVTFSLVGIAGFVYDTIKRYMLGCSVPSVEDSLIIDQRALTEIKNQLEQAGITIRFHGETVGTVMRQLREELTRLASEEDITSLSEENNSPSPV